MKEIEIERINFFKYFILSLSLSLCFIVIFDSISLNLN